MYQDLLQEPEFIYIDLFCGAGGTTTGVVQAVNEIGNGIAKVIACVNHDHNAILSHWANHPDVKHFEEDIRTLDISPLAAHVEKYRALYPNAKVVLWASLECTNFSKAKGGLAREADSRTLANHLFRYVEVIDPDYVQIENVVEFLDWGPERIKVKQVWQNEYGNDVWELVIIKNKHKHRVYGYEPIPQFKGQYYNAWCEEMCSYGYKMEWEKLNSADYGAYTSRLRLFGCFAKTELPIAWPSSTHHKNGKNGLKKWNAVKEKIDFYDEGFSIFYRGSNLKIPKRQRKDLSPNTLERIYAGCIKHIAGGKKAFMIKYHGGKPRTNDLEKPLTVIDTQNRHAFVSIYHGSGDNTHSIALPHPTIPAADINAVVFIDRDFGNGCSSSIENPVGSIPTVPKLNLIQADVFCNPKLSYLLNLQWGGQMHSVSKPSPPLLATADKTPMYLTTTEIGKDAIEILPTDIPIVVKLKEFMNLYGISDIKMRMLRVDELLKIQGFPDKYRLLGNQSDQKKFIGNSVVPHVVKAWVEAMYTKTRHFKISFNNSWEAVAA